MTAEEPERDEFRFTIDEGWELLQADSKCGERQNNGKRCTNPVTEWFVLDEDRPDGPKVGSCGMHLQDVARRVAQVRQGVYSRRLEGYALDESWRIARALKEIGFRLEVKTGYRSEGMKFTLLNPGEFLHQLGELGFLEKVQIDLNAPVCGAKSPSYRGEHCRRYKDHTDNHDDYQGFTWKEPEPEPEPEPVKPQVEDVGGQFS